MTIAPLQEDPRLTSCSTGNITLCVKVPVIILSAALCGADLTSIGVTTSNPTPVSVSIVQLVAA